MTPRALALPPVISVAAVALPGVAAAQFSTAQPAAYLLTVDAFDARAVWLQPAGLARRREALLGAHVSADRAGGTTSLSEIGATIASGGLALGWQRNRGLGSGDSNSYAAGLGLGDAAFSAGATRRWFRGPQVRAATWDIGARYQPSARLDISVVWRDITNPVAAGEVSHATAVPAAALNLLGGRARAGGELEVVTGRWSTTEVRAGGLLVLTPALSLRVRAALSPGLARRELALALEWSGRGARLTGFGADLVADVQRAGAAGALIADPRQPRRRGRR